MRSCCILIILHVSRENIVFVNIQDFIRTTSRFVQLNMYS